MTVTRGRTRHARGFRAGIGLALMLATLAACSTGGGGESSYIDASALSGDLVAHDPSIAKDGDTWFVYSTGNESIKDGNIEVRASSDGSFWQQVGYVWNTKSAWLTEAVPGVGNLWAPELIEHDGTWYLYYAASTFGSNTSVIGLATNTTLDPRNPAYEWVDQGPVVASSRQSDFNAIDPGIAVDESGTPWMSFGSFWSGIRMVELEWPSGLRANDDEPLRLAQRDSGPDAIEAPYLVQHDGDWFLFVSIDSCCRGVASTYKVAVGRADSVTGPYVDREGTPMLNGGLTVLLQSEGDRIGPGGESVYDGVMAVHYYDAALDGRPQLGLIHMDWDDQGWPILAW